MIDQAQKLRQMADSAFAPAVSGKSADTRSLERGAVKRSNHVIAVTSGKGGVGKSVFTVNLALALASYRKKVLIFDADFGLANIDVLWGLKPVHSLLDVLDRSVPMRSIIIDCAPGVRLIPGGSGVPRLANISEAQRKSLVDGFRQIESEADFIIIDTGAGIGSAIVNTVLAADEALVITAPEPTSITDAYAMIKVLDSRDPGLPIKLLVNMALGRDEADSIQKRMQSVCVKFLNRHINYAGFIPMDASIPSSVRMKRPLLCEYPDSSASNAVRLTAQEIIKQSRPSGDKFIETGREGLFARLSSIFAFSGGSNGS